MDMSVESPINLTNISRRNNKNQVENPNKIDGKICIKRKLILNLLLEI